MTDISFYQDEDVICDCSGTTKAKIQQLMDNGADTLDKISRATGACSGCGACDTLVLEMLTEHVISS